MFAEPFAQKYMDSYEYGTTRKRRSALAVALEFSA